MAADPEPETEVRLADVVVLRNVDGTSRAIPAAEATDDEQAMATAAARERKAIFLHREAGARARAGTLPRQLAAPLSIAVTNLMLAKILQEEIVPTTAKEAAEVAKVAAGIYTTVSGAAPAKDLTPVERATRSDEISALEKTLLARASAAGAQLSGGIPGGPIPDAERPGADEDDDTDQWEHDDEVPAPEST